jgi:iron-sulfur cluster assembly protein
VRILVDPKAVMFLIGTEMDFKRDKLAARFVFSKPKPERKPVAAANPW